MKEKRKQQEIWSMLPVLYIFKTFIHKVILQIFHGYMPIQGHLPNTIELSAYGKWDWGVGIKGEKNETKI